MTAGTDAPVSDEDQETVGTLKSAVNGAFGLNAESYPEDVPPDGANVVHVMQPRRDLPPGSWSKHRVPYITHIFVGFAAAFGMVVGPALEGAILAVPFVMLVVFICVRQTVEFMRRRDTPGRDLQHYMMGFMGGLIAGVACLPFLS